MKRYTFVPWRAGIHQPERGDFREEGGGRERKRRKRKD